MRHEAHDRELPKKLARYTVAVIGEYRDELATVYNPDTDKMEPVQYDIEILVDPAEFLDYVTGADLVKHADRDGLLTDLEETERKALMTHLNAVDEYDVQDLLDELFDAIRDGRTADALDAIDRYGAPKWASEAECKEAYDAAMKA